MTTVYGVERARQEGTVLGLPLGHLGFFQTLLMSFAMGFAAFFATTFVAIATMLVYMIATHRTPNFSLTYLHFGVPAGLLVFTLTLALLGTLWTRRKLRKS